MGIRLILLALLGLAACAPPTPPTAPRMQREVPFTVSTIGESWAITGRFAGTARVHADRVELVIPEAEIRYPSDPNLRLGGIYVALATTTADGAWNLASQTAPMPLASVFRDGSKTASNLRFTIAAPAGIDLSRHWIVIGMTETMANNPDPRPGHSFAHSAKDIFRER